MRVLTVERIVDPGSKKGARESRGRHFFRSEFSLEGTYRALGPLAQARDKVVSAINRSVDKMGIRDTACAFYDVINYYFEVDDPDGEGGLRQKGMSEEHRGSPIVQMGLLQDSKGIPIGYRLFPGTNLDGNWWVFDHRSDATDDLCRMAGIDLTRQNMQLKDIKAVLAQANRWVSSPNKKK